MPRIRDKYRFDPMLGRGPGVKQGRSWRRHQAAIWGNPRRRDCSYCPGCGACGYVECCGVRCRGGVGCVKLYTPLEIKHRKLWDSTDEDREQFYQLTDPDQLILDEVRV